MRAAINAARKLYLDYLPVIEFVGGQAVCRRHQGAAGGHMGFSVGAPRLPRLPLPAPQDAAARGTGRKNWSGGTGRSTLHRGRIAV